MATPETPKGPFTPGELLRQLREERKINSAREMARRTGLSHTLHSEQEKALGPINMQGDTARRMLLRGLSEPLGWADLDLVFPTAHGTVWSRTVLRRKFNALQDAAGVTRIKLYATRSTHGSLLADAGVNLHALAERLGHTDPRFTAKTYLRGSSSAHREVAERLGAVLGSSLVAGERDSSVSNGSERAREVRVQPGARRSRRTN